MNPIILSLPHSGHRAIRQAGAALAMLTLSIAAAYAAPAFDQPDAAFAGRVFATGAAPGAEASVTGRSFTPGQKVKLYLGGEVLNDGEVYTVDEKGGFQAKVAIPKDAKPGLHSVVASVEAPAAATVFDLKVVTEVPVSGADSFTMTSEKLVQGLYQSAYSPKSNALFVTAAVGRPPVKSSSLLKLDAKTLAKQAEVSMAKVPGREDGHVYAVYGVDVDDAHNNVWVTVTRDNTVAVYRQSDLKLVKQFEPGLASHARDVIVDEKLNKAYVSTPFKNRIVVFDTAKVAHLKDIQIDSGTEKVFSPMSLALDVAAQKIYVVSGSTSQVAAIDAKTDKVERVYDVPGSRGGAGVAVDPKGKKLFVASQGSDNLVILDLESGKPLHTVAVGAGALNVAFDAKSGLAYVPSRTGGTVAVVDGDGKLVANLPGGTFPNHVSVDGKGDVFLINKSKGADDAEGDRITRILPKK